MSEEAALLSVETNEDKKQHEDISVIDSLGSIVTKNQIGDNILISPTVDLRPQLHFFESETQVKRDEATKLYRISYLFGSQHGVALTNISIELQFDMAFKDIGSSIVGTGIVATGEIQRRISSDGRGYVFQTDILHPANYVRIEVISEQKPRIVFLKVQPR